jgi:hypothetical protein
VTDLVKVANDVARECLRRAELRDAVVEAARAWWDDDDRHPKYAQKLGMALEALEKAEAGNG